METNKTMLSINLKFIMKHNGVTVKSFYEQLHCSEKTVYLWRNGTFIPHLDNISNMCHILGINNPNDFFLEHDEFKDIYGAE
jgi:transcriptional regulator with XRE-family HTH domain